MSQKIESEESSINLPKVSRFSPHISQQSRFKKQKQTNKHHLKVKSTNTFLSISNSPDISPNELESVESVQISGNQLDLAQHQKPNTFIFTKMAIINLNFKWKLFFQGLTVEFPNQKLYSVDRVSRFPCSVFSITKEGELNLEGQYTLKSDFLGKNYHLFENDIKIATICYGNKKQSFMKDEPRTCEIYYLQRPYKKERMLQMGKEFDLSELYLSKQFSIKKMKSVPALLDQQTGEYYLQFQQPIDSTSEPIESTQEPIESIQEQKIIQSIHNCIFADEWGNQMMKVYQNQQNYMVEIVEKCEEVVVCAFLASSFDFKISLQ